VTSLLQNQFRAVCPECGNEVTDRTFVDRSSGWLFFRTVFECPKDNWALMTRLEEFNAIESDVGQNPGEVPFSIHARFKFDLNYVVIKKLIENGLENYPLSKVERYTNKWNETFYEKISTQRSVDNLDEFYRELATRYEAAGEIEMKAYALKAAEHMKEMAI